MGCTYKTTPISAATYHKLQSVVPKQSLVILLLILGLIRKLSNLTIHACKWELKKIRKI